MKSIAISRPNSSPATRVNLLIIEQAPKTANKNSKNAVHAHTLIIETTHKALGKTGKRDKKISQINRSL